MALLKKKENCPVCNKGTSNKHCASPSCGWYYCYGCNNRNVTVVFDTNRHYFTVQE